MRWTASTGTFAAEVAQDPTASRAIRELHHDLL
jgi:hypothetical protein